MLLFNNGNAKTVEERTGDILTVALPTGVYLSTLQNDDTKGRLEFYKSFFGSVVTTTLLKKTIQKERPNHKDQESFPSRHSTISFQSATFIHLHYGFKYSIFPYMGALFVAYSRVESNEHDFSDVIAGAFVGSLFSYIFTKPILFHKFQIRPMVFQSNLEKNLFYGIGIKY